MTQLTVFQLDIKDSIAHLSFNNPDKANSLNEQAWVEMKQAFEDLSDNPLVRVIILSGAGKHFCAGIDLNTLMNQAASDLDCEAKRREQIRKFILRLQSSISAIESCTKPVIAAIHGGCIGGGVDIASACDMRYCTEDAYFTIKETDLGLVADIGTLQRLPHIIQPGMMAEMAYTGRKVFGPEAKDIGLVNQYYGNKSEMVGAVQAIAQDIATKSPLVIRGIKEQLLYTRDHTVEDSLRYMATYNAGMLLSNDLIEAMSAFMEKRKPKFE